MPHIRALCIVAAIAIAANAAAAESIGISRVHRPLTLADFATMAPADDVKNELARVTGFTQREPTDGAPESETTDVYLGYDDTSLYAAFVCFDSNPSLVRAHMSRREDVLFDDFVTVQLDTFRDQRRAYMFGANALGVQIDSVWFEGSGFDQTFDTVFDSDGRLTDRGYVVLLRVPFASVRFPPREQQSWGLLLTRDIPRKSEGTFWPPYSRRIAGRLNQMAELTGLEGISPPQKLQTIPYSIVRSTRSPGSRTVSRGDAGLDAKYVVNDSYVIDAAVNPDFSQVESDEPQNTANERFELLFPEKRPFFLENASYFTTPIPLLFTRRVVDPQFGVRLTGKNGPWSIGVLVIDDQAGAQRSTNAVVRVSRDVGRQSTVGMMLTHSSRGDDATSVASADSRLTINENWTAAVQLAHSKSPATSGNAFLLVVDQEGSHTTFNARLSQIDREFDTPLGFTPRTDLRHVEHTLNYFSFRAGKRLVSIQPISLGDANWNTAGDLVDWATGNGVQWNFVRDSSFRVYYELGEDRLTPREYPQVATAQSRPWRAYGFISDSSIIKQLSLHLSARWGEGTDFFPAVGLPRTEKLTRFRATATLRPTTHLSIENSYLDLRMYSRQTGERSFRDVVARSKWNYQVNPRFAIRTIVQYDRLAAGRESALEPRKNLNADLLFAYIIHPGTALYAGYNGNQRPEPRVAAAAGEQPDFVVDRAAVFVKISYLFRH